MRRNGTKILSPVALALAGFFGLAGCDVDVPDLNNPGLDELQDDPTRTKVAAACTGLLIGSRGGTGTANGYITQMGILGREAYSFDPADPRYISELLEGSLSPASPFGGNFWAVPYTNMRLGDIIQIAKENVVDFTDEEKSAISGFIKTVRTLDLLRVITTRDDIGAVIDTAGDDFTQLNPIVSKDEVLAEMVRLLDEAAEELAAGGAAFPFALSSGYDGFDSPSTTYLQFNRALRARVALYQEDYETVLALLPETFIIGETPSEADLAVGAYHAFGTGTGDVQLALINVNIFAHPSVTADAEEGDARVARKVTPPLPDDLAGGARGLSSNIKFTIYDEPDDPVTIIRNEELILMRAEASLFTGDLAAAEADINLIREVSGELAPVTGLDEAGLLDQLLYERRYSLLFEGHRLIDMRRFGRIEDLPLDEPTGEEPIPHRRNVRWPLPTAECDARPGESACTIGSTL